MTGESEPKGEPGGVIPSGGPRSRVRVVIHQSPQSGRRGLPNRLGIRWGAVASILRPATDKIVERWHTTMRAAFLLAIFAGILAILVVAVVYLLGPGTPLFS